MSDMANDPRPTMIEPIDEASIDCGVVVSGAIPIDGIVERRHCTGVVRQAGD